MDNNKNYVAGVDFGSSNLVMAVGSVDTTGTLKVEALLSRPSDGIEMGVIQNVNNVCEVLREMKREIEGELGIRIDEAYASVSGAFIHYHNYSDHVFVGDSENGIVSQTDVDALNDRMSRVTVPEDEEVMDRFPLNYMLDHRRETDKPVGAFSRQLSSTFAFIIGKKQPLSRIEMVFANSGLQLAGIFANSAIVADAVLSADEKSDGAAVVDIGADTTDVAVYSGGIVRYAATIPMGGKAIDSDINKHGVAIRNIEALKKQCGTALSENVSEKAYIKIPTSGKGFKTVMKRNLAAIIEARLLDIIDYVKTEIKDSGYESKLPYGLVLTGGSASIPEIDRLFARHTERDVRVALATEGLDNESRDKIDSPEYTAVIALLSAGAAKKSCDIAVVDGGRSQRQQAYTQPSTPSSTELEFPKHKEKRPFEPSKSTATTYQPPQRPEYKPEPPVRPETPKPQPPTAQTAAAGAAVTPPPAPKQPAEQEQKPEKRVGEETKTVREEPEKPKRRWGFGRRIMDSLNGIFQDGADLEFSDTSLNASTDASEKAKKAEEQPSAHTPSPAPGHQAEEPAPAPKQPAEPEPAESDYRPEPKRSFVPKLKIDIDEFFVEGEDKEEI